MKNDISLVLATRNLGKIKEIEEYLKDYSIRILSLDDFGPIPSVEEDGQTFEENAYKKAAFTSKILGLPALADDSGLLVDALGGAPGVFSARYGGENLTDEGRCDRLLSEMKGKDNRNAAFQCVLSLAVPTGQALTYEASCEGLIVEKPQGTGGFGYDPIFYYPPFGKTFAEITRKEKSLVSHRGKALNELKEEFDKVLIWIRQQMPAPETQGCLGT